MRLLRRIKMPSTTAVVGWVVTAAAGVAAAAELWAWLSSQ
jgi:hypothetical protein